MFLTFDKASFLVIFIKAWKVKVSLCGNTLYLTNIFYISKAQVILVMFGSVFSKIGGQENIKGYFFNYDWIYLKLL
jgi:hypothetical protein